MVKVVIDSYSMICFLNKEYNYEKIGNFLKFAQKNNVNLLMSSINFGEIYYIVYRKVGLKKAKELYNAISAIPVQIINPDIETVIFAAQIKATKKMSYADCFAAALAMKTGAAILTGDLEFKQIEKEIKILWV